jgi:hypothetical protein
LIITVSEVQTVQFSASLTATDYYRSEFFGIVATQVGSVNPATSGDENPFDCGMRRLEGSEAPTAADYQNAIHDCVNIVAIQSNPIAANVQFTRFYVGAALHDQNPLEWANLAAVASAQVRVAEYLGLAASNSFGTPVAPFLWWLGKPEMQNALYAGNRAIFENTAPWLLAFKRGGISEVEHLSKQITPSKLLMDALRAASLGDQATATANLIQVEQLEVLQPILNQIGVGSQKMIFLLNPYRLLDRDPSTLSSPSSLLVSTVIPILNFENPAERLPAITQIASDYHSCSTHHKNCDEALLQLLDDWSG